MRGVCEDVARYYAAKLAEHGPTPRGVDWNGADSQQLRFTQLLTACAEEPDASVLDFGCGYGALAARLRRDGHHGEYVGFDVSPEMVEAATIANEAVPRCRFTSEGSALTPTAYTLASGIFNVRLAFSGDEWEAHIRTTLDRMAALSLNGFAFNMLTRYSDADRMRPDLYYADPSAWLAYCLERYSRHVALLHDYGLYEFTVIVRTSAPRRG